LAPEKLSELLLKIFLFSPPFYRKRPLLSFLALTGINRLSFFNLLANIIIFAPLPRL